MLAKGGTIELVVCKPPEGKPKDGQGSRPRWSGALGCRVAARSRQGGVWPWSPRRGGKGKSCEGQPGRGGPLRRGVGERFGERALRYQLQGHVQIPSTGGTSTQRREDQGAHAAPAAAPPPCRARSMALKAHRAALTAIQKFWECVLRHTVKFGALTSCLTTMDSAVKEAERVYK